MTGFRTPSSLKIEVDWQAYSSGLKRFTLEGEALGVVAALRAIASGEGLGVPKEFRTEVQLCDVGSGHGSIYVVESVDRPVHGREASEDEARKVGEEVLKGLGVKVRRDE